MPDTLRISFFGLATFVPDDMPVDKPVANSNDKPDGKWTRILFPPTTHPGHEEHNEQHHTHPMPPHEVRLYLGVAEFDSDTTAPHHERLDGAVVVIGTGHAGAEIPAEVFDLTNLTQLAVVESVYGAPDAPIDRKILNARLDFGLEGTFEAVSPQHYLLKPKGDGTAEGIPATMASFMKWTGALPDDGKIAIHRGGKVEMISLPAADGEGFVDLTLCHLPGNEQPPADLPDEVMANQPVEHFEAYYAMFATAPDPILLPFTDTSGLQTGASGCMASQARAR